MDDEKPLRTEGQYDKRENAEGLAVEATAKADVTTDQQSYSDSTRIREDPPETAS